MRMLSAQIRSRACVHAALQVEGGEDGSLGMAEGETWDSVVKLPSAMKAVSVHDPLVTLV